LDELFELLVADTESRKSDEMESVSLESDGIGAKVQDIEFFNNQLRDCINESVSCIRSADPSRLGSRKSTRSA
jgi:hypothetical protein